MLGCYYAAMSGMDFSPNREEAEQSRKVTLHHRGQEKTGLELQGRPWHAYAESAEYYLEKFEEFFPGVGDSIREKLSAAKKETGSAIAVDLAGAASAASLGATETICFTLGETGRQSEEGQRVVTVDLLSAKGFRELAKTLDELSAPVTVAFFRPVGAVDHHVGNKFSYAGAARDLSLVFERMAQGGEMIVDVRRIDTETENFKSWLLKLFDSRGAEITQGEKNGETKNIFRKDS